MSDTGAISIDPYIAAATTCMAFWSTEPTKYRLRVPTASSQAFMKMMFDDEKPRRIAVVDADRVGAVGVDERVHPRGDVADGLVPAGLDIGVADATHRIQDPPRVLDQLVRGAALGAEVVPGVRVLLVGGDLGDPVVLNRHFNTARGEAVPAEGVHRPGTHGVMDAPSPARPGSWPNIRRDGPAARHGCRARRSCPPPSPG